MTTDQFPGSRSRWARRALYVAALAAALAGFVVGAREVSPAPGPDPLFGVAFGAREVLDVQ